jgi:predicted ribosome quality control (RQC) complex YloA/Tae2 family protein
MAGKDGEGSPAPDSRIYRTFEREGWEILVGRGARENDRLTFEVARPHDLWMHVSGWSGSHVVVRVREDGDQPPTSVVDYAARLAAWHSKARGARGKVEVHLCRAGDVRKPPRFAPGKVQLARWTAVKVYVREPEEP